MPTHLAGFATTGSKLGYLQATVAYGLDHPDTGEHFLDHLKGVLSISGR